MNKMIFIICLLLIITNKTAFAQGELENSRPGEETANRVSAPWVIPVPTMGGLQYWSDVSYFQGWRIQSHALISQYRLLNPQSAQYAIGSFEHCKQRLEAIRQSQNMPSMNGKAVILIHGFASNRLFMNYIADGLRQTGKYNQIICFTYSSTQGTIETHAAALEKLINSLDGIKSIDFVAHSMGGLVLRAYMSGRGNSEGIKPDAKRFGRVVFIGTPNYGTYTAQYYYQTNPLARTTVGKPLKQMGVDWAQFSQGLIAPPCPFGVIAGGTPDGSGRAGGLQGDNDGVVELTSTRLAGAEDFKVLPYQHTDLLFKPETVSMTAAFLENGYFISLEKQAPLRSK